MNKGQNTDYNMKFNTAIKQTFYDFLSKDNKIYIKNLALTYKITFQDIKNICEIAKDLEDWEDENLKKITSLYHTSEGSTENPLLEKKEIIKSIKQYYENKKSELKEYKLKPTNEINTINIKKSYDDMSNASIFGNCPVFSDKTICCGLKTLDVVKNCPFNCSYCTIQTFYDDNFIFIDNLKEKLSNLSLDKKKFYHIGTGQSSDSLVWGNEHNILDDLMNFAKKNDNVLLELKTKSSNIDYFLHNPIPNNVVCSWSLNTEKVIDNEELGTASLKDRLDSAKKLTNIGIKVAFHFHPIIYYKNWENEYKEIIQYILNNFNPENILFISFGSLTFIKPVIKKIRKKNIKTKILKMETAFDPNGKITYPKNLKIKLYKTLFKEFLPWKNKIYFYLCMETADIWQEVFEFSYKDNEEFLNDFRKKTS